MSYLKRHGACHVPQCAPIPGSGQAPNSAGGFAWQVDDWTRLRRFLVLGSEGGSYDASEWELTRENATAVERCIRADGRRAVAEIVHVSDTGRAPKNDPALFGLAMAAGLGDPETRRAALDALPRVARTGAHLVQFATFVGGFRGWGRSLRRGVGRWYTAQPVEALAHQAVKYRQREGVAHRDLLRLSHPGQQVSAGNPSVAVSPRPRAPVRLDGPRRLDRRAPAARRGVRPGSGGADAGRDGAARGRVPPPPRGGPARAPQRAGRVGGAARRHADDGARAQPREDDASGRAGARVGGDGGGGRASRRRRAHPPRAAASGRGARRAPHVRGRPRHPRPDPVGAGGRGGRRARRRVLRGVRHRRADRPPAPARPRRLRVDDLGRARVCAGPHPARRGGGDGARHGGDRAAARDRRVLRRRVVPQPRPPPLRPPARRAHAARISPRQRLDDVVRAMSDLPFGPTDCALPMLYAQALEREVDTFVIYTDSETRAGDVHPVQALRDYRAASGIDARLVVVGMVSNGFSIADPADAGMLDVIGFDTATPQLIADFARHAV